VKKTTTKAAPKPKTAPKKSANSSLKSAKPAKKRAKAESDDENGDDDDAPDDFNDDSLLSNTPPSAKPKKAPAQKKTSGRPLQEISNESFTMDGPADEMIQPKADKKTSSDKYQKATASAARALRKY
jgi:DNA topoisomerase II